MKKTKINVLITQCTLIVGLLHGGTLAFSQDEVTGRDNYRHVLIQEQNDFLKLRGITDRQFTQALYVEYLNSKHAEKFKNSFLMNIFPRLKSSDAINSFGYGIGQEIYTPTNLKETGIIAEDRPYAGHLYLSLKNVSISFQKKARLTATYQLGVIGENAYAEEVQTWIHEQICSTIPQGWDNQISNDVALTFNLNYETRLFRPIEELDMIGFMNLNIGTVSNNVTTGLHYRIGRFNDYFTNVTATSPTKREIQRMKLSIKGENNYLKAVKKRIQVYGFMKTSFTTVLDNSLLEGGIFNRSSPHRIPTDDVKRFYLSGEYGYSINYSSVAINISQLFRTAEFANAPNIFWGRIEVVVNF